MFRQRVDHQSIKKLTALEHRLHRQLRQQPSLRGSMLLVACSGGRDSMVLASALRRLQPLHGHRVALVYVHHGDSHQDSTTREYRHRAQAFVREYADAHSLWFFTNKTKPQKPLQSEEELRCFRYKVLQTLQNKLRRNLGLKVPVVLCTAHHARDQLETRLLRLIRGTGAQGLKAMASVQPERSLMRPLVNVPEKELARYAKELNLAWVEDPSNAMIDAMRNWLRNHWLPQLEAKVPGAVQRLAFSLEDLASALNEEKAPVQTLAPERLNRLELRQMPRPLAARRVVQYFRSQKLRHYTKNHVEEVLKRLDSQQNEFTFSLLRYEWVVNAQHIWLRQK